MKKEHRPLVWLVINVVLLGGSLFMTWFKVIFIDPPALPVTGWAYIFLQLMNAALDYGLDWVRFSSLLEGIGGIFVIGYIIFIVIKILRRRVFAGSETRSIVLVVTTMVFLLSNLVFSSYFPLPGYWLFMAGSFSSAILEWKYSKLPVNLLTGKRTRKQ